MGYVHLTDISQFIPPSCMYKTAGTWTPAIAGNVVSDSRGNASAAFTILIPISLPGSAVGLQGAKLKSIDYWYKIEMDPMTDFATVALSRVALNANAVAVAGAAVAHSLDGNHDTANKRKTEASHKMTLTLTAETFIAKNAAYWLSLVVGGSASGVYTHFGAQVNYTLRL